jgi:hypothetical protein
MNSLCVGVCLIQFNNTFPFTASLPVPLSCPLPILCSLPFPGPFLTPLHVRLTLAVVSVIVITRTAPSTAQRSMIRPVVIIIILVEYLIPIQSSNGQEVAWLVLPVAWQLNLCPEISATVPRETLTSAFDPCRAGCLRN